MNLYNKGKLYKILFSLKSLNKSSLSYSRFPILPESLPHSDPLQEYQYKKSKHIRSVDKSISKKVNRITGKFCYLIQFSCKFHSMETLAFEICGRFNCILDYPNFQFIVLQLFLILNWEFL